MKQTYYNEMQCHFNLRQPKSSRPTKVYCVVYVDGKQLKLSTGLKVYSNQWDKYKQCAIIDNRMNEESKRNNLILNDKIIAMRKQFSEIKLYICNHLETNITLMIKTMNKEEKKVNVFKQFEDVFYELADTKKESTRKQYLTEWTTVKELFKVDKFEELNYQRVIDFKKDQNDKSVKTVKNGYFVIINSVLKAINNKDIFDYSNLLSKISGIKFPPEKANDDGKVALTDEQIQLIENLQLSKPKDILIKDIFLFMCYTGLRESDACQDFNDIKDIALKNGNFEVMQKKEERSHNAIVSFALNPHIKEILDAHNWNLQFKSIAVISSYIRNVLSNIDEFYVNTTLKVQKMSGTVTINGKLIDFIGGHTGRRTFITNLKRNGYSNEEVAVFTGHTDLDMIAKVYDKTTTDEKLDVIEKKHNTSKPQIEEKPQNDETNDRGEEINDRGENYYATVKYVSNGKLVTKDIIIPKNKCMNDELNIYPSNNPKDAYKMKFVDVLDALVQFRYNGIDIFETNKPLISAVINKIRNISTDVVNDNYTPIIWYICKHLNDTKTYQCWQMKANFCVASEEMIQLYIDEDQDYMNDIN
jgi:integrase